MKKPEPAAKVSKMKAKVKASASNPVLVTATEKSVRSRKSRPTTIPQMIHHRAVAERLGVNPVTVRRWVESGLFPRPTAHIGTLFFWEEAKIADYLATGRWPGV